MNLLQSLKLHASALRTAVDEDPKFFASVIHYVRRLEGALRADASQLNPAEMACNTAMTVLFYELRPSGGLSAAREMRELRHQIRTRSSGLR
jgi:hypothetical protein